MNSDDYYNQLKFWTYIRTAINTILLYHKIDSYATIMCNLKVPLLNWFINKYFSTFQYWKFYKYGKLSNLAFNITNKYKN